MGSGIPFKLISKFQIILCNKRVIIDLLMRDVKCIVPMEHLPPSKGSNRQPQMLTDGLRDKTEDREDSCGLPVFLPETWNVSVIVEDRICS